MIKIYKTGINTHFLKSEKQATSTVSQSIPVYVGFAPIHQLADYSHAINKPVLINSYQEAKELLGYSDDWSNYTLCEPIYAHFGGDEIVGPVVFINTYDPTAIKGSQQSQSLTFANGVAKINAATHVIANTVAIDGKQQGKDFFVSYSEDGETLTITSTKTGNLTGQQTVKWFAVTHTSLTKDLIKGAKSDTVDSTGIYAIEYVYYDYNIVPSLICVPKFSKEPDVREVILKQLDNLSDNFYTYAYIDLPAVDNTTDTYTKIIEWKKTNAFNDSRETLCFPRYKVGNKIYHLSTLRAIEAQKLDTTTDIPVQVPSNKPIRSGIPVSESGKMIRITEKISNNLEANGISTVTKKEGVMRLWGTKTAIFNYLEIKSIDPRLYEEVRVRSTRGIANTFKRKYFDRLHSTITRGTAVNIQNDFQSFLNRLISMGYLLYGEIFFDADENSLDKLEQGQFYFRTDTTSGAILNFIDLGVRWTDEGLKTLLGGGE